MTKRDRDRCHHMRDHNWLGGPRGSGYRHWLSRIWRTRVRRSTCRRGLRAVAQCGTSRTSPWACRPPRLGCGAGLTAAVPSVSSGEERRRGRASSSEGTGRGACPAPDRGRPSASASGGLAAGGSAPPHHRRLTFRTRTARRPPRRRRAVVQWHRAVAAAVSSAVTSGGGEVGAGEAPACGVVPAASRVAGDVDADFHHCSGSTSVTSSVPAVLPGGRTTSPSTDDRAAPLRAGRRTQPCSFGRGWWCGR